MNVKRLDTFSAAFGFYISFVNGTAATTSTDSLTVTMSTLFVLIGTVLAVFSYCAGRVDCCEDAQLIRRRNMILVGIISFSLYIGICRATPLLETTSMWAERGGQLFLAAMGTWLIFRAFPLLKVSRISC